MNNRNLWTTNTSGYKGVSQETVTRKYRAQFMHQGKVYRTRSTDTKIEAARLYDILKVESIGDIVSKDPKNHLNFPDDYLNYSMKAKEKKKTCNKCKKEKKLSEFYNHKHSPDGKSWSCSSCQRMQNSAWRAKRKNNPDQRTLDLKTEEPKEWVRHPSHYNQGKIEVIDAIEDWGLDFNGGNVVKYVARHPHKENALEDLKKAKFYLDRMISKLKEEN